MVWESVARLCSFTIPLLCYHGDVWLGASGPVQIGSDSKHVLCGEACRRWVNPHVAVAMAPFAPVSLSKGEQMELYRVQNWYSVCVNFFWGHCTWNTIGIMSWPVLSLPFTLPPPLSLCRNPYYGDTWANLMYRDLESWEKGEVEGVTVVEVEEEGLELKEGEKLVNLDIKDIPPSWSNVQCSVCE